MSSPEVGDYTKSPEDRGVIVKTLHPAIHVGLLARPTDEDRQRLPALGWEYIDLVAVNLYPFEQTIAKPNISHTDIIENIDIGGVMLIRVAAKNHERFTLVDDPADYASVLRALQKGESPFDLRKSLAVKGFKAGAHYDTIIWEHLSKA